MEHIWDYRADDTVVCSWCGLDYNNLEEGMEESCPQNKPGRDGV